MRNIALTLLLACASGGLFAQDRIEVSSEKDIAAAMERLPAALPRLKANIVLTGPNAKRKELFIGLLFRGIAVFNTTERDDLFPASKRKLCVIRFK